VLEVAMERVAEDDPKVRQIREAAKALFLRHGFGRVSTAALAKEAGVSKETLYSRYPSKEAVLADVLQHLIVAGEPGARAIPAPVNREELEGAFRRLARELGTELMRREYIELARIVIAETPRLPHVGEIFRQAVPQRAFERTSELLMAGVKAQLVRDVDVTTAARMFVGPLVVHALINVLLVAPEVDRQQAVQLDVDAHVDLFLAAVSEGER
jgi:TetR/AcrR family transcriptional repressor of mexJK operon